jgi:DNA modification methylase
MLKGDEKLLDPFGGTGKIFSLLEYHPSLNISSIEIEKEWASIDNRTIIANALDIPFSENAFDVICTSPTYGNRMADHHKAKDNSKRMTYTHVLGRDLHKDNSGKMQWGDEYRSFHSHVWLECRRVLKNGGNMILNIKNHVRNGETQPVTEWHCDSLGSMGFEMVEHVHIVTPSMRMGSNFEKRIPCESVIRFILQK